MLLFNAEIEEDPERPRVGILAFRVREGDGDEEGEREGEREVGF